MLGKICLILSSIVLVTTAQNSYTNVAVNVNNTKIHQFLRQWDDFFIKSQRSLKQDTRESQQQVQKIFNQAVVDVELNYGRLVAPVAEDYANALKVSSENNTLCNETCIVQNCFRRDSWVLNEYCARQTCNCYLPQPAYRSAKSNLRNSTETLEISTSEWLQTKEMQFREATRAYVLKVADITQEAGQVILDQLENIFNCNPQCLQRCKQLYGTRIERFGSCLGNCQCDNGFVQFGVGYSQA